MAISGNTIPGQQDSRNRGDDQHDEDSARVLPQLRQGAAAFHQQVAHLTI